MKKEYFTIPNLMGYFRILLIPVFLICYYKADTPAEYLISLGILAVSMLTDFFDGKIARKFNLVTDFGKALDPVADKLTQGALAIAVTFQYPVMKVFLILFLLKEIYMGIMGLYLIKCKHTWMKAQWYGKICTALVDVGIFVLLLLPNLPYTIADIIIIGMTACLFFSLIKYILFHIGYLKGKTDIEKE